MRLPYFMAISLATLLIASCSPNNVTQQPDTPTTTETVTSQPVTNSTGKSGVFQNAEHPTTGNAKVITENGKKYLEFDASFKTDSGPDLFVILHKDKTLPNSGIKEADYVSIAPLTKISGTQKYPIPENIDLAKFQSVAIWCRKFNATFGYAPL